jgi:hypothetical protein
MLVEAEILGAASPRVPGERHRALQQLHANRAASRGPADIRVNRSTAIVERRSNDNASRAAGPSPSPSLSGRWTRRMAAPSLATSRCAATRRPGPPFMLARA